MPEGRLERTRKQEGRGYTFTPNLQGAKERARRLRQIRRGALKGAAVSEAAIYAAHGLVSPSELKLTIR